jgi:hypothetical protein
MESLQINNIAIIVAALSSFVAGGVWYSLLFNKAWMQANNFTEESIKNTNKVKIFGLSFLFSLVMAYNLGYFISYPSIDAARGALYGLLTGVWIAAGVCIIALFEHRSWRYMFINAGYMLVALTLMGLIIGAWN